MPRSNTNPEPVERGPMDQFSAHLDRGWDLIHRGDLAGARVSAEKSIELDAQSPEAFNLLGYVRAAQGEAEEALEAYRHALALDDTFVEAMLNAAEVLIHPLHDFESAQDMVRDALDFAEDDDEVADALLVGFDAALHEGDRAAAARVAARLPDGPFKNEQLDFLVGRAHFEVGDTDKAKRFFDRAAQGDALNPDLYYYRGLLHEADGEDAAATIAFMQARRLDQTEPAAPWALSLEHFEQQVKRAIAALTGPFASALDGAMVVVSDLPGVELVADGVDPRSALVLDGLSETGEEPKVRRIFLYQRNIERAVEDALELPQEIANLLTTELAAAFPALEAFVPASARPPGAPSAAPAAPDDREIH